MKNQSLFMKNGIVYNVPGLCEVPNEVRELGEGFSPNRIHRVMRCA